MSDEPLDWSALLQAVRTDYPTLYRAWFESLEPGRLIGGELRVSVADPAWLHYLREHCAQVFSHTAMELTGHLVSVRFESGEESVLDDPVRQQRQLRRLPLNPDYTFAEFVVGPSNRLAHAAGLAVCSQPGVLYNPLFIHGASGLGKSHLLQAICAELLRSSPDANVIYVACDTFVSEYVSAIEAGDLHTFRNSVRQADALLIDDVQFLANRESSQEELFHTFNALYQERRQIVLSADSPPSDIPNLEDRLVSRFNWGLVAQIDPPTRETRQAILQKKARLRGYEIPADVIDYVAEHVDSNIRTLEGTLTKLITLAALRQAAYAGNRQRSPATPGSGNEAPAGKRHPASRVPTLRHTLAGPPRPAPHAFGQLPAKHRHLPGAKNDDAQPRGNRHAL